MQPRRGWKIGQRSVVGNGHLSNAILAGSQYPVDHHCGFAPYSRTHRIKGNRHKMLVLEINEVTRCQVKRLQSSLYQSLAFIGFRDWAKFLFLATTCPSAGWRI